MIVRVKFQKRLRVQTGLGLAHVDLESGNGTAGVEMSAHDLDSRLVSGEDRDDIEQAQSLHLALGRLHRFRVENAAAQQLKPSADAQHGSAGLPDLPGDVI